MTTVGRRKDRSRRCLSFVKDTRAKPPKEASSWLRIRLLLRKRGDVPRARLRMKQTKTIVAACRLHQQFSPRRHPIAARAQVTHLYSPRHSSSEYTALSSSLIQFFPSSTRRYINLYILYCGTRKLFHSSSRIFRKAESLVATTIRL